MIKSYRFPSYLQSAKGAWRKGADYLVGGRPITESADPRAAAEAVVEEMGAQGSNSLFQDK